MRFMYLDECKSPETDIVSLTAIVVDESKYIGFRRALHQSLKQFITPEANTFCTPPDVHGSSLGARLD